MLEDDLAEKLDMSRTPIRRAMQKLESELILETVDGKTGMRIYYPEREELLGLVDVRIQLETAALVRAMSRGDKDKFFPLLRHNENLRKAITDKNIRDIIYCDDKFHGVLYELSDCRWLEAIGVRVNDCFALFKSIYLRNLNDGWEEAYSQHLMIYNLIMAGNVADAADLMRYHISYYKWKPGCLLSEVLGV